MLPDKDIMCHRTGFARSCRDIVKEGQCRLWMQLQGSHPQTGEQMSKWGCADEFVPLLLIENSQQQRETGSAVESFRNEMVRANQQMIQVAMDTRQPDNMRLINQKGET